MKVIEDTLLQTLRNSTANWTVCEAEALRCRIYNELEGTSVACFALDQSFVRVGVLLAEFKAKEFWGRGPEPAIGANVLLPIMRQGFKTRTDGQIEIKGPLPFRTRFADLLWLAGSARLKATSTPERRGTSSMNNCHVFHIGDKVVYPNHGVKYSHSGSGCPRVSGAKGRASNPRKKTEHMATPA